MNLDHSLFFKALKGENLQRPPVWMMRQAGRYLPEYMVLRKKYDFFTRVETPELACEITLQPIDILDVDAAILFSDILVIPQAMGQEVQLIEKKGPILPSPIRTVADIDRLEGLGAENNLQYVYDAVRLTRKELASSKPLIGFAGAPFTLLCYMVEGQGSKTFSLAKQFCFAQPALAHKLLNKITDVTIEYLKRKVEAGVNIVQVFDSWSGLMSHEDFNEFCLPYLLKISNALSPLVPVILFPKGSWYALEQLSESSASAIGIDWTISPRRAREISKCKVALQGNLDPSKLLMSPQQIQIEMQKMIKSFGKKHNNTNLSHGIMTKRT
jgi:uroporphyrinogen decarboxylase